MEVVIGEDQLELRCTIAVQGDDSTLNSFSYQANVLLEEAAPALLSLELTNLNPILGPSHYSSSLLLTEDGNWGGRVTLSFPASGLGVLVALTSNKKFAAVPSAVYVPAGSRVSEFRSPDPAGHPEKGDDVATITASFGEVSQNATLRVAGAF